MPTSVNNYDPDIRDVIGQRLMVGFDGASVTPNVKNLICERKIGNFILFRKNYQSPAQLRGLTRDLQRLAGEAGHPAPLFIAVDHEGGRVWRFPCCTRFPSQAALGATGSARLAYLEGRAIARDLRKFAINMNLSPVLDLANPRHPYLRTRCFSDDPKVVGRLGSNVARGLSGGGVYAVGKHFPGLGAAEQDPHVSLPAVRPPLRELITKHVAPFRTAIRNGLRAVMVGHAWYTCVDKTPTPASVSRNVISRLLRRLVRFRGLVISDDMEMGAVTESYDAAKAAVSAVRAGVDIVMFARSFDRQTEAYDALLEADCRGMLTKRTALESVKRILAAKHGIRSHGGMGDARRNVTLAREIARRAMGVSEAGSARHSKFVDGAGHPLHALLE